MTYYDQKFTPWRIKDGQCVLASEAVWRRPVRWNAAAACCQTCDCNAGDHSDCCPQKQHLRVLLGVDPFKDRNDLIQGLDGEYVLVCDSCGAYHSDGQEALSESCKCGRFKPRMEWATMSDLRTRLYGLIDATPNIDWLVRTRWPENVLRMWPNHAAWNDTGPSVDAAQFRRKFFRHNLWLGVHCTTQAEADARIPALLKCRDLSPVLWAACDGMREGIDFTDRCRAANESNRCTMKAGHGGSHYALRPTDGWGAKDPQFPGIDWLTCSGERGKDARPMHPDWVRSLRDQCVAAGTPWWFAEWGEYLPFSQAKSQDQRHEFSEATKRGEASYFGYRVVAGPQGLMTATTPGIDPAPYARVGHKAAGRLLDGVEWSQVPEVQHG